MIFHYRAATMDGTVIENTIEAEDRERVVAKIKDDGYVPISVSAKKEGFALHFGGSGRKDVLVFTMELSALLGAGLPLDRALWILSEISEDAGRHADDTQVGPGRQFIFYSACKTSGNVR
jgi:general secretion pathway protein F